MKTDQAIVANVKNWLEQTQHTQKWLAEQLSVTPAFISQLLNNERKLQTKYIIALSKATGRSLKELSKGSQTGIGELTYTLRGQITTADGNTKKNQLLLDVTHYIQLKESRG